MATGKINGKYRNKFESKVARALGKEALYEPLKLAYTIPETSHKYTPDFVLDNTNIIIETKGRLTREDRKKMLLVKQQHPQYRWVFIFMNNNCKIYKGAKMTYKQWALDNGFEVWDI